MTEQEYKREIQRCDEEIAKCEQSGCLGAIIGWLDWHCEKREIEREYRG